MPSVSKCLVLLCVTAMLLASAGAFATLEPLTATFIRNLGTSLGTGWDTTADPCGYSGITCVTISGETYEGAEIDLSGQSLSGLLPGANGASYVTKIDLSDNNGITGDFPSSWASMTRVTDIDLSNTQLTGQIPDAWNAMVALVNVKITNTKACYRLPSWSGDALASIKTVDLSSNYIYDLTATGFSALATSTTLTSVDISNNPLCGCINDKWRTNAIMVAAAQAALPSSVDVMCFSMAGASCPFTGVCLADSTTTTSAATDTTTNPDSTTSTRVPIGNETDSTGVVACIVPALVVAAVSAATVLLA